MNRKEVHYHLRRLPTCVVVVASVPGTLEVALVPHLVHHSPTGLEFGYVGSGLADLALSLLTFHLEAEPTHVKRVLIGAIGVAADGYQSPPDEVAFRVVALYQRFKADALDLSGAMLTHWITCAEANVDKVVAMLEEKDEG